MFILCQLHSFHNAAQLHRSRGKNFSFFFLGLLVLQTQRDIALNWLNISHFSLVALLRQHHLFQPMCQQFMIKSFGKVFTAAECCLMMAVGVLQKKVEKMAQKFHASHWQPWHNFSFFDVFICPPNKCVNKAILNKLQNWSCCAKIKCLLQSQSSTRTHMQHKKSCRNENKIMWTCIHMCSKKEDRQH